MAKKSDNSGKKSKAELLKVLAEKKQTLRELRFGSAGSKSTNVKAAKSLRREVAQTMTHLAASQTK